MYLSLSLVLKLLHKISENIGKWSDMSLRKDHLLRDEADRLWKCESGTCY